MVVTQKEMDALVLAHLRNVDADQAIPPRHKRRIYDMIIRRALFDYLANEDDLFLRDILEDDEGDVTDMKRDLPNLDYYEQEVRKDIERYLRDAE